MTLELHSTLVLNVYKDWCLLDMYPVQTIALVTSFSLCVNEALTLNLRERVHCGKRAVLISELRQELAGKHMNMYSVDVPY